MGTRYSAQGLLETLPDLNSPRHSHGCTSYISGDTQVFLVTAGITGPGVRLCTTETWRPGELHWTNLGELPVKAAGIRAVSLNNRVFAVGDAEYIFSGENVDYRSLFPGGYVHSDSLISYLSSIYELDTNTSEWRLAGELRVARAYHGVSVTSRASVEPFCVN